MIETSHPVGLGCIETQQQIESETEKTELKHVQAMSGPGYSRGGRGAALLPVRKLGVSSRQSGAPALPTAAPSLKPMGRGLALQQMLLKPTSSPQATPVVQETVAPSAASASATAVAAPTVMEDVHIHEDSVNSTDLMGKHMSLPSNIGPLEIEGANLSESPVPGVESEERPTYHSGDELQRSGNDIAQDATVNSEGLTDDVTSPVYMEGDIVKDCQQNEGGSDDDVDDARPPVLGANLSESPVPGVESEERPTDHTGDELQQSGNDIAQDATVNSEGLTDDVASPVYTEGNIVEDCQQNEGGSDDDVDDARSQDKCEARQFFYSMAGGVEEDSEEGNNQKPDFQQHEESTEPDRHYNLRVYTCSIQPVCTAMVADAQPTVTYTHGVDGDTEDDSDDDSDDSDDNNDNQVKMGSFSFASEHELNLYDVTKHIVGVEEASKIPNKFVDVEGNDIYLPTDPGNSLYCGTVKYAFKYASYSNIDLSQVTLSDEALKHVQTIQTSMLKSTKGCEFIASQFLKNFKSHFVIGETQLGCLFEWVVMHDTELKEKTAKRLTEKIYKALGKSECCLLGSVAGEWYEASNVLKSSGICISKPEEVQSFKIRITKYGGGSQPQSYGDWLKSTGEMLQIPLSSGKSHKIIPVWNLLDKNPAVVGVLKTTYSKFLANQKKAEKKPKNDRVSIAKQSLMKSSTKLRLANNMPVYSLPLKPVNASFPNEMIKKCEVGSSHLNAQKQEKVIMIVGATGSGKTTLINSLVNFLYGVDFDDDFRFKLIIEGEEGQRLNQARSITTGITSYTLHYQEGFQVPYSVTVIDTPGFGDTDGIAKDKEITEQIRHFFTSQDGIDHIDAVGFVAQASLARLTPTQRYIFDSILSLFGNDIESNIFMLLTFADGQEPQILDGLKEANLPHNTYFKFNNSAMFVDNTNSNAENGDMDALFWKMGIKSFVDFFAKISVTSPTSLMLTKDVLNERAQLENSIVGIQRDIQKGLNFLEQLQTEVNVLRQHEHDIEQNKDFEYYVDNQKVVTTPITGRYTTNCLVCNRTCHDGCLWGDDDQKKFCIAMSKGKCTVCLQCCDWTIHKNQPFVYEIQTIREKMTSNELKQRYQDAAGKKLTAEQLIKKVCDEFEAVQIEVITQTENIRLSLNRLQEIALKPNPLSTTDYISILIETEKSQCRPGWQARVRQLEQVWKQADCMAKVASQGFDPFQSYLTKINNEKHKGDNGPWARVSKLFKKTRGFFRI